MRALARRLLVVDDTELVRKVMVTVVRDLADTVDEAGDGEEGLSRFHATRYDLVLTDWNMPRVDGLSMLRAIRAGARGALTPVVMLSGQVTRARIMEAISAGADAFMPKPFERLVLRDKVIELLRGSVVSWQA